MFCPYQFLTKGLCGTNYWHPRINLEGILELRLELALAVEVALSTETIQAQNEDTNISKVIMLNLCFMGVCRALHNKIGSSS